MSKERIALIRDKLNSEDCFLETSPNGNSFRVASQFRFPDGDHFKFGIDLHSIIGYMISDEGSTIRKMSEPSENPYWENPELYFNGPHGVAMGTILKNNRVIRAGDGSFRVYVSLIDNIADGVFRLGQALSQIYALSYFLTEHTDRMSKAKYALKDLVECIDVDGLFPNDTLNKQDFEAAFPESEEDFRRLRRWLDCAAE